MVANPYSFGATCQTFVQQPAERGQPCPRKSLTFERADKAVRAPCALHCGRAADGPRRLQLAPRTTAATPHTDSHRRPTPINREHGAGDVGGFIRCKKESGIGHFPRCSNPVQERLAELALVKFGTGLR